MGGEWRWSLSGSWFWLGVVLGVIMMAAALWNLVQQRWDKRWIVLEATKVLLAALVVLALARPETWREEMPDEPTRFILLQDASASMDTRDVSQGDGGMVSRREWVASQEGQWQEALGTGVRFESVPFERPDSGVTDLHRALLQALERASASDVGGVILLSDGDWNVGERPVEAAHQLRRKGVPLLAVSVGSEEALPDLKLSWLPMPSTLVLDEPVRLPFRLENRFSRDVEVEVSWAVDEEAGAARETRLLRLEGGESVDDAFLWRPDREGPHTLTLTTPVIPGEIREDNNRAQLPVKVTKERLNVLLVDSAPRWEFRYLRNALMRDPGVELACVLFHPDADLGLGEGPTYLSAFPESMEELTSYDVVFLGDVGLGEGELTEAAVDSLCGLVEAQASGLVFLPGRRGGQERLLETRLEELLPVVFDRGASAKGITSARPAAMELTPGGRQSVLTLLGEDGNQNATIWRSLPGFHWHAPVSRAKAGATVLAVHETERNNYGRLPLLVTRPFGAGKVLFLGTDGAWRWRRGVEDRYHYRFWGQVARWMAYQRNLAESARGRIIHYPDAPVAGRDLTVHATLLDTNRGPLVDARVRLVWERLDLGSDGDAEAEPKLPADLESSFGLSEADGGWGVYRGTLVPPEGGTYELRVELEDGEALGVESTIVVASPERESVGDPARPEVLQQLADAAGGDFLTAASIDRLADRLLPLTVRQPEVHRTEWWRHPLLLTVLVLGFSGYWVARKRMGLV